MYKSNNNIILKINKLIMKSNFYLLNKKLKNLKISKFTNN